MKADLIEIHVVFDRPKSYEHMERIGQRIAETVRRDLVRRFPKQLPTAYVADVRGDDDDADD